MLERLHGRGGRLQQDGTPQPVRLRHPAVLVGLAVAEEHQLHVPRVQLILESGEVWGNEVAKAALEAPVRQQDALTPERLEPDHVPREVREAEEGKGGSYRQPQGLRLPPFKATPRVTTP